MSERKSAAPAREVVLFDSRWKGPHGIGRFAEEVHRRIPSMASLDTGLPPFHPLDPLWTSWLIARAKPRAFFTPGFNAPLRCRIPFIMTVYDLNYVHLSANFDPFRRAYFTHLVRPACRRAHRVLTVSDFSRDQIVEWAGTASDRIVNVGAGVDDRFRPEGVKRDPGFPYVLAIGSERPHKNIPRLLRAFAASGLSREVKLLISGSASEETKGVRHELRLEDASLLIGRVAEKDLPALYRGALALCMPSLSEGFGLPVLEAMASGVPVMAANSTALPEVAGSAAVLVDPTDVDAMAEGLRRVVMDETLRAELIGRGLARSKDFSWDRTAQRVGAVLRELS
jgi:glycosyltransferase involved in cell wall biosynthesis